MINPGAFAVVLFLAAPVSAAELQERYFSRGWAQVQAAAPAPLPARSALAPGQRQAPDLHNPVAHMYITGKAFEVYAAQFGGGELARYIGSVQDSKPSPETPDTVIAGAFDEDKSYKNPFGELIPVLRHFWDSTGGPYKGYQGNDSSVNRAQKYWTGGFGLDGKYDKTWKGKGDGALALYRKGEKGRAYWYLGHIAHLVEDITVPPHAHLYTHVGEGSDAYETYMKHHFGDWRPQPGAQAIEDFASLYELFEKTAAITNGYDAGSGPGDKGRDGQIDKGLRRAGGFSDAELIEEGNVLMPLAYNRVAALFVYFYKQVDHAAPRVTLARPRSEASACLLQASASDEVSGVDKAGYVFEYRRLEGRSWSAWRPVASAGPVASFSGQPGVLYSFRVWAVDAAGNRGRSAPRLWRAPASSRRLASR